MKNIVSALIFCAMSLPQILSAQAPEPAANLLDLLRPGTTVLLETTEAISSTDFEKGDPVALRTRAAIIFGNQTIIATGAEAKGTVHEFRPATPTAPAAIAIEATEVLAANGVWVQLEKGLELFEGFVAGEDFTEVEAGTMLRAKVAEQIFPNPTAQRDTAETLPPGRALPDPAPSDWAADGDAPADDETEIPTESEAPSSGLAPLPEGTEITLELDDEAVPAQAKPGDLVRLRVAEDVETDEGQILFREGAPALGTIKHVGNGNIYVAPASATAADGQKILLEGRSLKIEFDADDASELLPLEGELAAKVAGEAMVKR